MHFIPTRLQEVNKLVGGIAVTRPDPEARPGPRRYLRAAVAVARSAKAGEYVVAHFSSGTFFRIDALGAQAVRALVDGASDLEAMQLVEERETGAGQRLKPLIDHLFVRAAMTSEPPARSGARWAIRRRASPAIGTAMSMLAPFVRFAPTRWLAWVYRALPSTPIGRHVWRSCRFTIVDNLRASGFGDHPEPWLRKTSQQIAACTPGDWFFLYMTIALSPARLERFVSRVFDAAGVADLASRLRAEGPAVITYMHGPLSPALPNALRALGVHVVRTTKGDAHGVNVSDKAGPLSSFFAETPDMAVDLADENAAQAMLQHLGRDHSIYISLDKVASPRATAEIGLLGQRFSRNDEPAWLAVRSGRPVILVNTFYSGRKIGIDVYPTLYPQPGEQPEADVERISTRLYQYGESALRAHPESWACWTYMSRVQGLRVQEPPPQGVARLASI